MEILFILGYGLGAVLLLLSLVWDINDRPAKTAQWYIVLPIMALYLCGMPPLLKYIYEYLQGNI